MHVFCPRKLEMTMAKGNCTFRHVIEFIAHLQLVFCELCRLQGSNKGGTRGACAPGAKLQGAANLVKKQEKTRKILQKNAPLLIFYAT